MNEEITIEHNGILYIAEFEINDDMLITHLPDGSSRNTELRGLKPKSTAEIHLRSYIRQKTLP